MCLVEVDTRGGMRRCLTDSNLIARQLQIQLNAPSAKRRIQRDPTSVQDAPINLLWLPISKLVMSTKRRLRNFLMNSSLISKRTKKRK